MLRRAREARRDTRTGCFDPIACSVKFLGRDGSTSRTQGTCKALAGLVTETIASSVVERRKFGVRMGPIERLFQPGILGLGLNENRDVLVAIFPEGEKYLISIAGLGIVALQCIGSG